MRVAVVIGLVVLCGWAVAASDEEAKVYFFGFVPGAGPSFERSLDRLLRERLRGVPEANLAGLSETATLKRRMDQSDFGRSSKAVLDALTEYTEEDDIVAWGRVRDYSIYPRRRMVFGACAVGEAMVSLYAYHPRTRRYLFVGGVSCESSVPKPPVWFRRVALVTHITARDRAQITEELTEEAAGKAAGVYRALVRHHFARKAEGMPVESGMEVPVETDEDEEVPSLEDLFEVPMSEPAVVIPVEGEEGLGGEVFAPDTAAEGEELDEEESGAEEAPGAEEGAPGAVEEAGEKGPGTPGASTETVPDGSGLEDTETGEPDD